MLAFNKTVLFTVQRTYQFGIFEFLSEELLNTGFERREIHPVLGEGHFLCHLVLCLRVYL